MGRAAQIVELCAELVEQVRDNGASKATALMELGGEFEGYCFEITYRKVQPGDFDEKAESHESCEGDSKP